VSDTLNPRNVLGEARWSNPMARRNYPDEFKRDAVALYRDTEGATITVVAAELDVSEATLSAWCKTGLSTERDILRSAAKYFAGETNW